MSESKAQERREKSAIMMDITTFHSARDYITYEGVLGQENDPFAKESYCRLLQTLCFYDEIYVAHPKAIQNVTNDYFEETQLLYELLKLGVVKPLSLDDKSCKLLNYNEKEKTKFFTRAAGDIFDGFFESLNKDEINKIGKWVDFQKKDPIIIKQNKLDVSLTGIDDDKYGELTKKIAKDKAEKLKFLENKEYIEYFIMTIIRSVKYGERASVGGNGETAVIYNPFHMRRDFLLRTEYYNNSDEDEEQRVFEKIDDFIKSIKKSGNIKTKNFEQNIVRIPFMGGVLWGSKDYDKNKNKNSWVNLVAERIAEVREEAKPLREKIASIKTEADYIDFDAMLEDFRSRIIKLYKKKDLDDNNYLYTFVPLLSFMGVDNSIIPYLAGSFIVGQIALKSYNFITEKNGGRFLRNGGSFEQYLYKQFSPRSKSVLKESILL